MPTIKQKKAVDKLVGNGGNVTKAMRESGYSENTLNTPQKLTESKGFKEALKDCGLTEELITSALVDDIKKKPKNRLGELRLGSEILGMKENDQTVVNIHNYSDDQSKRIAKRALQSGVPDGKGGPD